MKGQTPAEWVAELPAEWTSPAERLVLYVLALDAPNGVTRSGRVILATRTGLGFDQLRSVLHTLSVHNGRRPPLIERLPPRRRQDPDRYRLAPGATDDPAQLLPLTAGAGSVKPSVTGSVTRNSGSNRTGVTSRCESRRDKTRDVQRVRDSGTVASAPIGPPGAED